MVDGSKTSFAKKNPAIFLIINRLKVADKEINDISELPKIHGDEEILLAVSLQNAMEVKNAARREAVASKTYASIETNEDANKYLAKVLTRNLRNEFAGRESQIRQ